MAGTNLKMMPPIPMVGYAYVPDQTADFENIYSPEVGFEKGTIFPILDKPLGVYGKQSQMRGQRQ